MNVMPLCLFVLVATFQPADKVPVFVTSPSSAEGFTDPSKDRQDSMKDLTKRIKDSKLLMVAQSAEQAVVILEVLGRGTNREVNGWAAVNGQAQNKSFLTVILKAGSYTTELTGTSGSKGIMTGHGAAAGKVIEQVEAWVKANRDKLAELKKP